MAAHAPRRRTAPALSAFLAALLLWAGPAAGAAPGPSPADEAWAPTDVARGGRPRWREGRLVVRYRAGGVVATEAAGAAVRAALGASVERRLGRGSIEVLRLPAGLDVPAALEVARRDPRVSVAEPDYLSWLAADPDDPLYPQQWALNNVGQETIFFNSVFAAAGYVDADADAPEAWAQPADGAGAVVAVVDTGVDTTHADLAASLWTNPGEVPGNGVDDDGNGWVDDVHGIDAGTADSGDPTDTVGHGTHVAGIVAAQRGNGAGVAGLAPGAKVVAVKIFTHSGDFVFTSLSAMLAGLEYVRALRAAGVPVVATNNSWGGGDPSTLLEDEIRRHGEAGILFVAAAGNDYTDNDAVRYYPASYPLPNVVSVAATTNRDEPASFTNVGRRTVDLGAPGRSILSTVSPTSLYTNGGEEYVPLSGTSMAAPHVAAAAAIVAAARPGLPWWGVRNLLLSSGDPLPELRGLTLTGRRLNAAGAAACAGAGLLAGLEPSAPPPAGVPAVVRAISIRCDAATGPVTATLPDGTQLPLHDDGAAPDEVAGDGLFAATWEAPSAAGQISFASPVGTDVLGVAPRVAMADLPEAWVGYPYNRPLQASNGTPPFSWSVTGGTLPPGLQLVEIRDGRTGELYWHQLGGTPTAAGSWTFTIAARDATGATFSGPVTLRVGRRLEIAPLLLPEANPAWPYAAALAARNAGGPVSWSIPAGALPGGLALDPGDGSIAGNAAAAGDARFIVRALDGAQPRQERAYRLRSVDGPFATSFASLQPPGVGIRAVAALPDGGSVLAGTVPGASGWGDALLARFDGRGELLWLARHDGPGHQLDDFNAVAVGADGTIYAAGSETSTSRRAFVAAYSPGGAQLWGRAWDGANSAQAVGIALDAEGAPCVGVARIQGMAALRYLPDGTLDWASLATTGPGSTATAQGIARDENGDLHVVGWYRPDGVTNATAVASFGAAGAYLRSWAWIPGEDAAGAAIVALPGPVLAIAGNHVSAAFLAAFSTGGSLLWSARESWPGRDVNLYRLAVDAQGGLAAAGQVSWRPDPTQDTSFDTLLVRYGADGSRTWARTWDLSAGFTEIALGVAAAADGVLHLGITASLDDRNDTGLVAKVLDPAGAVDADGDGVPAGPDCDDTDPLVLPGAAEDCDGVDDNCNGAVDEGFDADGDGATICGGDCDDADPLAFTGAPERCDGKDDDCDGIAEEYVDADLDGVATCAGDCDDADPGAHPGATEVCNGRDDSCDGAVDEGFDADGDGVSTCGGDCDDANAAVHPGAAEVSRDGVDQDCNGYDLTIRGKAVWDRSAKTLRVIARSDLGKAAKLRIVAPARRMEWNPEAARPRWQRLVREVPRKPAPPVIAGVEGSTAVPLRIVP